MINIKQTETVATGQTARSCSDHAREGRFCRKHRIREAFPVVFAVALSLFLSMTLAACGGKEKQKADSSTEDPGNSPVYQAAGENETHPETMEVEGVKEEGSVYFGIMHVTLLEIHQEGEENVYTFRDRADPDNAWIVNESDFSDIETELTENCSAVLLFNGDAVSDESVLFIAALPEDDYTLKYAEGTTTINVMSSFTLRTKKDELIVFTKDNCRIEGDALANDKGDRIRVYYAQDSGGKCWPFKVYKAAR